MKTKEITVAFKRGMPDYSSVFSSITITVEKDDKLTEVWETARQEAWRNCTPDPDWLEKEKK